MTPERLALVVANCPADADFTLAGPIVTVVRNGRTFAVYERKMFLDGFTSMNKVLGPGPNAQPAPEPVRHYEIWCEDTIIRSGSY
jgi:hypothetical protein